MRIRSIKPEFWRSTDVTGLPMDLRLLFVGLWSYVDDNGVGIDDDRLIQSDLFALEDDPTAVRAWIRDSLATLSRGGLIHRYQAAGKRLIFVTGWDHQRIDKPAKPRWPRPENRPPTSPDDPAHDPFATPSRDRRDTLAPGTGEQGNGGTGIPTALPAEPQTASASDEQPAERIPAGPGATGPNAKLAWTAVNATAAGLPQQVRGQLARVAAQLLDDGTDGSTLTTALARWRQTPNAGPGLLPNLVADIIRETESRVRNGHVPSRAGLPHESARSAKVRRIMAAGEELAASLGDSQTPFKLLEGGASA